MPTGGFKDFSVTIADGESLSSAIEVRDRVVTGLIVPAMTSAALSFQVSIDGQAFSDLYDDEGNEVTIAAGTHDRAYYPPSDLLSWPWLKIRSGTAGSPTNQSGGKTIQVATLSHQMV